MKNLLIPLANSVLVPLGLKAVVQQQMHLFKGKVMHEEQHIKFVLKK